MSELEKDYDRAAEWAERDMTLKEDSTTALRGEKAATFGRELLPRSSGGRPPLDRSARPASTPRCGRFGSQPRSTSN